MKVRVLYFAALRDLVGRSEEHLELPDSIGHIQAFASYLERTVPNLAGRLSTVRIARNDSFSQWDERVEDGDVIALLPPVSGG